MATASVRTNRRPFNPHFTDHVITWIESLPFPRFVYYLLLFGVVGIAFTLLSWVLNITQPGVFVASYFILGTWFVENLFINHFLVRAAETALSDFRPMLPAGEERYRQLIFEFTHIPGNVANIWLLSGGLLGFGVSIYAWRSLYLALPIPDLFIKITASVGFALFFTAVFRAYHQIRIVRRLLGDIPRFSLYDLGSIYAISLFPVKMILINIVYLWVNPALLVFPEMFRDVNLLGFWVLFSLLPALAIYPSFHGIRRRMVAEKEALLKENGQHLEDASKLLYKRMSEGQHDGLGDVEKGVSALLAFRREIESISTWPWKPETMRWLVTAMVLPLALWVIQLIVQRVVIH